MTLTDSTTLPRRAAVLLGLALIVLASACSSSSHQTASSTSSSTALPAAAVTTTASVSSSSTVATKAAPKPPSTPIAITTLADGTSPDGSGCSPGATTLPDGIWFGVLKTVDTKAGTVGIDLACWFAGDAANAAAVTDDPGAEVPVPNDYYVRNQVPTVYTTHATPDVAVVPLEASAGGPSGLNGPTQTGVAAATGILNSPSQLVWLKVTDGWVTVVQAQFTP